MMKNNNLLILIALLLFGILTVLIANPPERRTAGDKISDGINQIGEGIGDAARDATKH